MLTRIGCLGLMIAALGASNIASAQKLQLAVQQSKQTGLPMFVMGSSDT